MSISINIINGIARSIDQIGTQGELAAEARGKAFASLNEITAAIDECINGFRDTKVMPYKPLARFLTHGKTLKQVLGDGLDEKTTGALRAVLVNAQIFDKDLEVSLSNFKPKLLQHLVLGPPIKSLFSPGRAMKKVLDANERLKKASANFSSAA